MNRSVIRRVAAPSLAALALGLAVSACGAGNEDNSGNSSSLSGTLKGAGSSAQDAAEQAWRAGFQTDNPKVTVNYDPSGSGAGVKSFTDGAVDFAGSDAALDPTKGEVDAAKTRCGGNALEIPNYVSAIAIVYNLDGVDELNLSPATAAKIFDGQITQWNDPAIAAENPNATLPAEKISPTHRSDESGTTKNFTDYLNKASGGAWKYDADKVWPLKSGEAANGNPGVAAAVKAGKGSIGYVDESQAGDLGVAGIKVGAAYVKPSAEGAAKALEASPTDDTRTAGDLVIKVDRTTTADGAYPLMLLSYAIACPTYDSTKADLVKSYLTYMISTDGQAAAASNAGSAPLPTSLQDKAKAIIDTIAAK